jgi:pimeloyl-ACP methyl ester carboxylesterase
MLRDLRQHRIRFAILAFAALSLAAGIVAAPAGAQRYRDFTTPRPLPPNSYLIIGFMGSLERWNSEIRSVRKLALDLRAREFSNVYVETLENKHGRLALRLIRDALDRNRDGKLDEQERASARIILYGHSLGGAAVVKLARDLKSLGVPVLLTIQVDSVGFDDRTIPENVARAANFYQHNSPLLRGRGKIRAADPQKTLILGNFKYDYSHKHVDLSQVSFLEQAFGGAHTRMEFDPDVWAAVEHLILQEIE